MVKVNRLNVCGVLLRIPEVELFATAVYKFCSLIVDDLYLSLVKASEKVHSFYRPFYWIELG